MESIVITWRELLMVVALILAVYVAEMLLLMRKGGDSSQKSRWPGGLQETKDNQALLHEIEQIKARLTVLEGGQVDAAGVEDSEGAYQRAIQLARQGRDASSIIESCGMSRGEAEMIVSLHGPRK